MSLRKSLLAVAGLMLATGVGAFGQETQSQSPSTQPGTLQRDRIERQERHRERMGEREGRGPRKAGERHRGLGHMMHELNLSDEQRQQSRAIMQRRLESMKGQREELFRLREKRIAGTFTAEDGARAQALHQEMRTAMEGTPGAFEPAADVTTTTIKGEQRPGSSTKTPGRFALTTSASRRTRNELFQ